MEMEPRFENACFKTGVFKMRIQLPQSYGKEALKGSQISISPRSSCQLFNETKLLGNLNVTDIQGSNSCTISLSKIRTKRKKILPEK